MFPTLQLGPAALPLRPVIMLLAFWLCLTWSERRLPHYNLRSDLSWNFGMVVSGVGVVTARLWYAATHWSAYQANLTGLFSTSISTLALGEGLAVGLIAGLIYLRRQSVALAPFADAFTPGLLIAFGLASLGALMSGDAYGAPSDLPWAITLWEARRHPSQIYELLAAIPPFVFSARLSNLSAGFTFLSATVIYAVGRVFVEAFRGDSLIVGDGVRVMQVVWLSAALAALLVMYRRKFG